MTRGLGGPRVKRDWRVREAEGGFCAPVLPIKRRAAASVPIFLSEKRFLLDAVLYTFVRRAHTWPASPAKDAQSSAIAKATAMPTPTRDRPPTTDASQTTSRSSA